MSEEKFFSVRDQVAWEDGTASSEQGPMTPRDQAGIRLPPFDWAAYHRKEKKKGVTLCTGPYCFKKIEDKPSKMCCRCKWWDEMMKATPVYQNQI
jgi:hypothetical protein